MKFKRILCAVISCCLLFSLAAVSHAKQIELSEVQGKSDSKVTVADVKEAIKANSLENYPDKERFINAKNEDGVAFKELVDISLTVKRERLGYIIFYGMAADGSNVLYDALYSSEENITEVSATKNSTLIGSLLFDYDTAAEVINKAKIGKPISLEHDAFGTIITTETGKYIYTEKECVDRYGPKIDADYYYLSKNKVYTYSDYQLWYDTLQKNHDLCENKHSSDPEKGIDGNGNVVEIKRTPVPETPAPTMAPKATSEPNIKETEIPTVTPTSKPTSTPDIKPVQTKTPQITVNCSDWARDSVIRAISLEILRDEHQNNYEMPISREDFCIISYNMLKRLNKVQFENNTLPFVDTDKSEITALANIGIINGRDEKTFAPNDSITREEAASVLARMSDYLKIPVKQAEAFKYNDDGNIADWAKENVYKLKGLGIMEGTDVDSFSPQDYYTKEQSVATIMRIYDILN